MKIDIDSSALAARPGTGARSATPAPGFSSALGAAIDSATPSGAVKDTALVTVRHGDTLSTLIRDRFAQAGVQVSRRDTATMVGPVAAANGIANPDRIFAGARVDLSMLSVPADAEPVRATQTSRQQPSPPLPPSRPDPDRAAATTGSRPSSDPRSAAPKTVMLSPARLPGSPVVASQSPPVAALARTIVASGIGGPTVANLQTTHLVLKPQAVMPQMPTRPAGLPLASPTQAAAASAGSDPARALSASRQASARQAASAHPVLDKTLQRAVDRGFMPARDLPAARDKVLRMAGAYGFAPDDFARVALMESDGFNPKATNGRCHGIIQFCEGPQRGAASVGLEGQAHTILDRGVLQQLELVDQYFKDTGLQQVGPRIALADLYLTVLTPSARGERKGAEPLNIAGPQASALHVAGDRSQPITRNSITEGLQRNASQRLADQPPAASIERQAAAVRTPVQRQAIAAGVAYQQVAMLRSQEFPSGRATDKEGD